MKSFFSLTNLLMVTIIVGCISLLLFSDRGLINLWSLKKEKLEIQNEINDLELNGMHKSKNILNYERKIMTRFMSELVRYHFPDVKSFKVAKDLFS